MQPTPFAFSVPSSVREEAGNVMGRWALTVILASVLAVLTGCGSDKDKGKNRNKDRPTSNE